MDFSKISRNACPVVVLVKDQPQKFVILQMANVHAKKMFQDEYAMNVNLITMDILIAQVSQNLSNIRLIQNFVTVIYKQDLHYLAHVWCGTQYAETCSNCPLDGCGGDCTDPCKDKWPITKCEKNKEKGWCIPPKGKRTRNNCKRTCGICEPDCVDK